MAKSRQVQKRLNDAPQAPKPAERYAADWDNPNVQSARVAPLGSAPKRIPVGNDGIVKRGK